METIKQAAGEFQQSQGQSQPQQQQGSQQAQAPQGPGQNGQPQDPSQGGQQSQGSPDQQLEASMFSLAYEKLQAKLYNLLPHLVGFSIIHKEADNSKIIGVFGFASDSGAIIYIPAFFISGQLKDLELMYSKNTNSFFPLDENFAELLLKNEVSGLGAPASESRQDIERSVGSVDLRSFMLPPLTGRNSFASVIDYIEDSDNNVKSAAWDLMEKDANFTEALRRYYTDEQIAQAFVPQKVAKEIKVKAVKVEYTNKGLFPDKTQDTKGKGYRITDTRKPGDKSKFGVFEYRTKISNPVDSGFYTYITESGALRYGLILVKPQSIYEHLSTKNSIVIDLDSDRTGQSYVLPNDQIFVRENIQVADYKGVLEGLEDPAEGKPSFSDTYILVNKNLRAVEPFRIISNYKDDQGIRRLKIEKAYCEQHFNSCDSVCSPCGSDSNKSITLVLTKKDGDVISYRGLTAYIPSGYKLLKIETSTYVDSKWDDKDSDKTREEKRTKAMEATEKNKRSRPGRASAVLPLFQSLGVFPMSVQTNGSEYYATIQDAKKTYPNPMKAKIGMVLDIGLDEKQADELIDSLHIGTPIKGYCKVATTGSFNFAPPWEEPVSTNELGQPTTFGQPYMAQAPQDDAYTGDPTAIGLGTSDPNGTGIQQMIQQATQMANAGQKDIFDTQAIGALAKYTDPSSKVLSYVPSFLETTDKLGRILFMLNWDMDKFQKAYGRDSIVDFSELVKSVFNNMGDLVIFLKRKFPDISINSSEQSSGQI